jgi:hypothetical protein
VASDGGVVAQGAAAPVGVHVGNGAINVVGVDTAALVSMSLVASGASLFFLARWFSFLIHFC